MFLISLIIGECLVRQLPNPYKIKHEWMLQHAEKVETIFLGSSHTYYGIRPEFIPNSINLANVSQNLMYDYFVLEQYGVHCAGLKTIVLPISYFTFFSKGFEESEESWWYAINYKVYMNCPYHSDFSKYNFELAHGEVFLGKLKSSIFGGSNIGCDSLGWGTTYELSNKLNTWDNTSSIKAVERHTVKDWSFIDRNIAYIKRIIEFCQARSISLVLITTPTWSAYNERLDKKQLEKMYALISEMQQQYNLPYHNYLKDDRFVPDDFFDSDHLSDIGAKKFSIILRDEVLSEY